MDLQTGGEELPSQRVVNSWAKEAEAEMGEPDVSAMTRVVR